MMSDTHFVVNSEESIPPYSFPRFLLRVGTGSEWKEETLDPRSWDSKRWVIGF